MNKTLLYIFIFSVAWCSVISLDAQNHVDLSNLYNKKEITLVITDSGLGGLTVMDDISRKMKESGCYKKVNLVFVNAWFDENSGYNALQSRREKIEMFDRVLTAIGNKYNPDAILIGCNTLSVIFDETSFSRLSGTPVIGIVDAGVSLIDAKLKADPSSRVIIFGTETTVEEESHREGLLKQGIAGERIFTKACPQLQSYIEQSPMSEQTEMLISVYMNEALEELEENDGSVYISLNCSHFGYSEELWRKAFGETAYRSGGILNPNGSMSDILTDGKCLKRFGNTKISLLVVSKVTMPNAVTISGFFREESPDLTEALKNYTLVPDLF